MDHHKQGTLFFTYAKTLLAHLVVLKPSILSIKKATMALSSVEMWSNTGVNAKAIVREVTNGR